MTDPAPDFYCSHGSLELAESIHGTAPQVNTWLLLEHPGPWGHSALSESDIDLDVQVHLVEWLAEQPNGKLLLIRRDATKDAARRSLYLFQVENESSTGYRLEFDTYTDLLKTDLDTVAAPDHATDEKLLAICTNGRRDKCCARYGLPVFNALKDHSGLSVWECSHVGQHRFAANLIALPAGMYFGRVSLENGHEIAEAVRNDETPTPNLRGRASYPKPAQAAEVFLRQALPNGPQAKISFLSQNTLAEAEWQVELDHAGERHTLTLTKNDLGHKIYASCEGGKQLGITEFRLTSPLKL